MDSRIRVFLLACACVVRSVQGGGADGGGGDTSVDAHSMWFGNPFIPVVRYCMEFGRDFGASEAEVDSAFLASLKTWIDYAGERKVPIGRAGFEKMATGCDGAEDLAIYLGYEGEPKIKSAKQRYLSPIAFTQRQSYSPSKYWGKGFLWVASSGTKLDKTHSGLHFDVPSWKKPYALQAVLTHELGHILGCGHHEGTVMDSRQPRWVAKGGGAELATVDQTKELVALDLGKKIYRGGITGKSPSMVATA